MPANQLTSGKRVSPKRALNVRPLACLTALVVCFSVGLFLIHRVQIRRNASALLEQAKQAEASGDLGTAEERLKLYLGFQPRNAEAFARYALLLAGRARSLDDWVRALLTYDQVLRLDPSRGDIRRRLVDVAIELRAYHVARHHLEALIDSPGRTGGHVDPKFAWDDADLEMLLGRCYEGENDYPKAAASYKRAIERAPHRMESYVRLAEILRNQLHDPAGADRVMDASETKDGLVAANKNSARAYLERSRYRKKFQISGVEDDVARALKLAPTEPDARLAAAELAIERRDYEVARRHLTQGIEHARNDWRLYRALALLERGTGHLKAAGDCLRRGIEAATDARGRALLLSLEIDVLIDSGQVSQARGVLERLASEKVSSDLLRYHSGRILMSESKWIEAAKELEISSQSKDDRELAYQANLLLAACYEAIGDFDRHSAAFLRAIELQPDGIGARLGRAATLRAAGRVEEALNEYRGLSEQMPSLLPTVARLQILHNLRSPNTERDWHKVDDLLQKADGVAPGSSEVVILRAESLVAQDQWDRAREILTKARDKEPERADFWVALAELAERRETSEKAEVLLDQAERRLGDRVALRLARVSHWAKRGGAAAKAALAALNRNLTAFAANDQEKLLRALGEAYLAIGDTSEADRIIGQLIRIKPYDLGLRFYRFELALERGDRATMEAMLAELASVEAAISGSSESAGAYSQCAQARYLVWSAAQSGRDPKTCREIVDARSLLGKASAQKPTWPLIPLYEAELEDFSGNPEPAIKGYLRAIELGMQNAPVVRRAVQLLFERGRYDQADELLQTLQEKGIAARDSQLRKLAAEVTLQTRDPARAVELARRAVPADSRDYRDRLWLGQILWAAGQTKDAVAQARAAMGLANTAPETLVLLVQYLNRSGQRQEAKAAIQEAEKRLSGDYALLALARSYAEVGDFEQANDRFRRALAQRPDDVAILRAAVTFDLATSQWDEAERHLRQVRAAQTRAPADDTWARRQLAVLLAAGGDQRKVGEAMEILGIVDDGSAYQPAIDEPLDELRAKAKVLASRKNRTARRAAIRVLQQITEQDARAIDDRLLLGRLYEAEGDRIKSEREAMSLLDLDGQNPNLLAHAALTLLRHGANDRALPLVEKLEKLQPKEFRTTALRAQWLKAKARGAEAIAQIKAFVVEKPAYLQAAARLAEDLNEFSGAEALYRKLAAESKKPEAVLAYAAFLGRQHRLDEALDLCDRAWLNCPPELVAHLEVAILYSTAQDDERTNRVAESLTRELAKRGPSAGLLFQLANVRSLQGRYDEAEAAYQESHRRDETKSGPLSNLAWLLARRDGNGQRALELVAAAVRLDGPTPDLVDTRAVAYMSIGRSDMAVKDLEEVVDVEPSALKYIHLAQACVMAGKTEEAKSALKKARTVGFALDRLSPLERESCQKLLVKLAAN